MTAPTYAAVIGLGCPRCGALPAQPCRGRAKRDGTQADRTALHRERIMAWRAQQEDGELTVLHVSTRHPQDYVLHNEADGTRWRGTADGGWSREVEREPSAGQMLGNLLARIHRDGGHYVMEHGWQKAAEDAEAKVVQWLARDDAGVPVPDDKAKS